MTAILPGTQVAAKHVNLKLGPGLLQLADTPNKDIISTKAGTLNHSANGAKWWIEGNSRRYTPAAQESVIGIIAIRASENYRVDIGGAHYATLDALAFEGATKRNRPNLKIGSLVYARVSLAHKDMDPELECFDAQTHKAEGFGELKDGFMVSCSLQMCRMLLDPSHFLLPLLGTMFPLDAAVGTNGRVWIDAKEIKYTIAVSRCIEAVDPAGKNMSEPELREFLKELDVS